MQGSLSFHSMSYKHPMGSMSLLYWIGSVMRERRIVLANDKNMNINGNAMVQKCENDGYEMENFHFTISSPLWVFMS